MQNVQTGLAEDPALSIENVLDLFSDEAQSEYGGNMNAKQQISD